jgi:predicted NBD/HSP70 family sugar kinase
MVRRIQKDNKEGTETVLAEDMQNITARRIHEAALAGDETARRNIEMTGRYLGLGVSNLMHILNPEVIAFSGGMTGAGDMLMKPLLEEADWRTMEAPRRDVKICFAELPEDAGVIGAARCFMLA